MFHQNANMNFNWLTITKTAIETNKLQTGEL